jgi:tight adherence protein C
VDTLTSNQILTYAVPIAGFGCVAALVWMLVDWFNTSDSRVDERLDGLRDPRAKKRDEERYGKGKKMAEMFEKATVAMSKPLTPKNEQETSLIKERLCHAGFRGESAPQIFWGCKFIGMLIGFVLTGGFALFMKGNLGTFGLLKLAAPLGILFFLPDIVLWWLGSSRKQKIFLGLPDALDLMVVCVEAGLGLDQALRKVTDEMKKVYPVIAEEFGLCNLHLQMGKPKNQVLQDLGQRSGVDDLRALSSILIQADKFGSSVAQALRVQSESMRTRRKQLAEEKAAKTAVKLIFPLVLFIFPSIFVVLVGPAAIKMIREMLPAMGNGG